MKKLILLMISMFFFVNASFALSNNEIPDEFDIKEHWVSLTTSYDIETKTEKLGTLYRKFFSLLLSYEFYDAYENKLATARSKFFSWNAHFDIYDNDNNLLGAAEERFLDFYPSFNIYAKNGTTLLAKAKMNFWGTTFSIYEPRTNMTMATIHRSFFHLKNNWKFKVINRELLNTKNIDPKVLLTVVAFQGDRESWEVENSLRKSLNPADKATAIAPEQITMVLDKINNLSKQQGFTNTNNFDPELLESIATELEVDYNNSHPEHFDQRSDLERMNDFTEFCLNITQSNGIPDSKKQAILHLLKMRLEKAPN